MNSFYLNLSNDLSEFDYFLQGCGLSDNTIRAYNSDLKDFLLYCEKEKVIDKELSENEFKLLCDSYIKQIEDLKIEKYSSKKRRCSTIRKLTSYVYIINKKRNELCLDEIKSIYFKKNFHHAILTIKEINILNDFLNLEMKKAKTIIKYFKSFRNKIMLLTILYTGIRALELINLKWEDISFSESYLYITKGNNEQNRSIKLNNEILKNLLEFKEYYKEFFFLNNADDYYVFCSNKPNNKLTTKTIRYVVGHIDKMHIIEKSVSPLTLRHTMVFFLLKNKYSLYDISKILGHKHYCSTEELYENLLKEF